MRVGIPDKSCGADRVHICAFGSHSQPCAESRVPPSGFSYPSPFIALALLIPRRIRIRATDGGKVPTPPLGPEVVPNRILASGPPRIVPFWLSTGSHLVAIPLREAAPLMSRGRNALRANSVTVANHSQPRFVAIVSAAELADDADETLSRFVGPIARIHFSFSPAGIGINLSRCRSVETGKAEVPTISISKVIPRRFLAAIFTVAHADSLWSDPRFRFWLCVALM